MNSKPERKALVLFFFLFFFLTNKKHSKTKPLLRLALVKQQKKTLWILRFKQKSQCSFGCTARRTRISK